MPISQLQHYHDNARQGDIGAITVSLAALGQYRRVIVNEGTKTGKPWEVLVARAWRARTGKPVAAWE